MPLTVLWLCSRWSLNSPVTFVCLTSGVNLPRAEKFWRHTEHRHATGFPSIFSTTINSGIHPASHNREAITVQLSTLLEYWRTRTAFHKTDSPKKPSNFHR